MVCWRYDHILLPWKDHLSNFSQGATVQVLLFAQLAAKLKLNAPNAHTWLEIVSVRWGTFAHSVFLFFGLATNIIVSSMLILGGSATVTDLTGMNTIAVSNSIYSGIKHNICRNVRLVS